jgi:hypothetical protein
MCFQLYAGTRKRIPRSEWNQSAPDLYVEALSEQDAAIRQHFSSPEVQYMGSTSCCGCDFPHLMFQNRDWPRSADAKASERDVSDRYNQVALVTPMRNTGEETVELYGVWNRDFSEPKAREEIALRDLLDPAFYFKEQGFYKVRL